MEQVNAAFNNQYVAGVLILVLILYASRVTIPLPQVIDNLFNYTIVKLIFYFLLAYVFLPSHNPLVALIVAIGVIVVIELLIWLLPETMENIAENSNAKFGCSCKCNANIPSLSYLSEQEHRIIQEAKRIMEKGKAMMEKAKYIAESGEARVLYNKGLQLLEIARSQIKSIAAKHNSLSEEGTAKLNKGKQLMEQARILYNRGKTQEAEELMEEGKALAEEGTQLIENSVEYINEEPQNEELQEIINEGNVLVEEGQRLISEEGRVEEGEQLISEGESLIEEANMVMEMETPPIEIPEYEANNPTPMEEVSMEDKASIVIGEIKRAERQGRRLNKQQIKQLCSKVNDEFAFNKPSLVELADQYAPALVKPAIPPMGLIASHGMPGTDNDSVYAQVSQ